MVVIRLTRGGAKKSPFYHIVAADSRMPRDGRYIERLGYFNPVAKGKTVRAKLDTEAANGWIKKGAQPSDRVKSLLREMSGALEISAQDHDARIKAIHDKKAKAKAAKKAAEAAAKAEEAAAAEATDAQSESSE